MSEANYTLEMPVFMGACGPDGTLRSHIFFDYLQHIAAWNAEEMGFGMSAIKENNLIWVLSRLKLQIEKSPRFDDVMRVETYHNGTERIFAKRQFALYNAKTGERFACATSYWMCLQLPSLRPKAPAAALGDGIYANAEKPDFFPHLEKLESPAPCADPVVHNISSSHIDLNDHLNNAYYAAFTTDWIARQVGHPVKLQEIQLNFNRAMMFGEDLIVSGVLDRNQFYVEGIDRESGKNSFQSQGSFV